MKIRQVIENCAVTFTQKYGDRLRPGHRSCPQCQHHLGRLWPDRQKQKLLPVEYFMVTFTLAWQQPSLIYDLLLKAFVEAIRTIGRNNHDIELAMTVVLHTHKRDKGFHPYAHFVVPGGGLRTNKNGLSWKSLDEKFLVNEFALANIFRGILLRMLFEHAVALPYGIPKQWVANIRE